MPELPEVEVCRVQLWQWTRGRRIVDVVARDPAVIRDRTSTLPSAALAGGEARLRGIVIGATPEEPRRIGKRIGWTFEGRDDGLLLHLGMTGQWLRRGAGDEPRHAKLALVLDDDAWLWLTDPRRFGYIVPWPAERIEAALRREMGPDALRDPPDAETLRERLRGRRAVKVALMDQRVVAGVGNIHASEALWRTRIHPDTPCEALTGDRIAALAAVLPEQMREFVDRMLADGEHAYVNLGGPNPFDVYDREGEPCPRCATPIAASRHAGRSTFFCPRCQTR